MNDKVWKTYYKDVHPRLSKIQQIKYTKLLKVHLKHNKYGMVIDLKNIYAYIAYNPRTPYHNEHFTISVSIYVTQYLREAHERNIEYQRSLYE